MDYKEIETLKESKEYKALSALSDACNDFGFKPERFAKGISLEHRTLQQKLCSMAVAILREMGSEGYMHDGRNEASVRFCRNLVESGVLDDAYFPCV